ncbi:MAG: FG-GAP repeat protein [Vicinamibacterales bacterium]
MRFRAEEIAADFGIGYAVTTGDVNGDGRTDVEHRCLRPRHAGRQDLLERHAAGALALTGRRPRQPTRSARRHSCAAPLKTESACP